MRLEKAGDEVVVPKDKEFDLLYCLTREEPNERDVAMALYAVRSDISSAAFARNHEALDALAHQLYVAKEEAKKLQSTEWRTYGILATEVLLDLVSHMVRFTRPAKKDAWVRKSKLARKIILFLRDGDLVNAKNVSRKFEKSERWTRRTLCRLQASGLVSLDDIGKGDKRVVFCRLTPVGIALQEQLWLEERRRSLR